MATETTQEPKEARGVTELDYQHWRHNPVTMWFMTYLQDYRADLLAAAQENWLADTLTLSTEHEMKGRARCLDEVATIPFTAIATFYRGIDQTPDATEGEDATKAVEDNTG